MLDASGLNFAPWEHPDRVLAYASVVDFVQAVCRTEAPDIGLRVVSDESFTDLGYIGALIHGAATPRQALIKINTGMAQHASHEIMTLQETADGMIYRLQFALKIPAEALHFGQQYAAAFVRTLCLRTGYTGRLFDRIEMTQHPGQSFAHLGHSFGCVPVASAGPGVAIFIPNAVLDRPFTTVKLGLDRSGGPHDRLLLLGKHRFSRSVRMYIDTTIDDGIPSAERLAELGGISLRTFQRRLAEEGTSYSALLDEIRRRRAVHQLAQSDDSIARIGQSSGYAHSSSFTRAVRRWTAATPRQVKRTLS